MFDFFKRKRSTGKDFSYDQAVILEISLDTLQQFGSEDDRANIEQLEKEISDVLPNASGIDGHEFGEGQCTMYIYGIGADIVWKKIKPILRKSPFEHIDVTLQYGKPDNPKTRDRRFTL